MTSLEIIKDKLARIDEARAKATQGKWQVSEESFFEVWTFPETNLIARLSPKDDFSFGKTSCYNNSEFIALSANEITKLSKALSVAVETLQTMNHLEVQFKAQGGVYNPKLGCVKHETIWDVTTKPSEDALTTIANILSGGKDGNL